MSQTYVAAPRPARSRIVVLAVVVAAVIAAGVAGRARSPLPPPVGPEQLVCEEHPVDPPPPPPKRQPTAAEYDALAACMATWRADPSPTSLARYLRDERVTASTIRSWIEVDGDPAWFDGGAWWYPLSPEGSAEMPSGAYGIVPGCSLAIVN